MTSTPKITRRNFVGTTAALLTLRSVPAVADLTPARMVRLSEGVRLVMQPQISGDTVAITMFVRQPRSANTADEAVRRMVNTALFGGSTHMSLDTILDSVRKLGSVIPRTLPDGYCVTVLTSPDQIRNAAYLLCEALKNAQFDKDALERARVGLLQARQDRRSDPFLGAYDALCRAVTARPEPDEIDLRHVNTEAAIGYHRRNFVPVRTVFSAAGHFDGAALQRSLDNNLFEFDRDVQTTEPVAAPLQPGPPPKKVMYNRPNGATEAAWAMVASPAPYVTDPDFPGALAVSNLLGGGHASVLFQELREKAGIGYTVGTAYRWEESAPIVGYVAWDTGADTVRRPTSPDAVTEKIVELMDRPGKDPSSITQADVDRARNFTSGQYLLRHERVSERSFLPGWFEVMGAGYAMDAALPALVQSVTLADMRRIAAVRLSLHTILG